MRTSIFCLLLLISGACQMEETVSPHEDLNNSPPQWTNDAIWYQIFPERFYNGDSTNDPRPRDMKGAYPDFIPAGWQVTPWTWEWHRLEPWLAHLDEPRNRAANPINTFNQKVQWRRYGGDIAGILAKLDYLDSLGVNALYINPLNDAPSLHKYDARNWRHIDRNFGPDPDGDALLMAEENPQDRATWQWTAADSLFLKLIEAVHARDMRLIMDYSWNHTGRQFWAWQDILKQQEESPYKDWYWIESFDRADTDSNEFSYKGWLGLASLPEIKDTPYVDHHLGLKAFEGQVESDALREHIYSICERWLDPNGDGNPSDGVDGFRLDVAAEMPLGFWREFRQRIKALNPEAYLIGELWWQKWPDQLLDPAPYLKGDVFDAYMNYRWFRSVRHFLMAAPDSLAVGGLKDSLLSYAASADEKYQMASMLMSASHDAPRLATALFNRNAYKQGAGRDNPDYKIHKPNYVARNKQLLFLLMQFSMPGAPQIFNGDEMGMWGGDDPGNRKPLIWPEFNFEPERQYPFIKDLRFDRPQFDTALFRFYQSIIELRKDEPTLRHGRLYFPEIPSAERLLTYDRVYQGDTLRALINATAYPQSYLPKMRGEVVFSMGYGQPGNNPGKVPPLSYLLVRLN